MRYIQLVSQSLIVNYFLKGFYRFVVCLLTDYRASINTQMCVSDALQFKMMHYNYGWYITMMHNRNSQEHIYVKYRTRHEQIHTSWPQYIVAETLVTVICDQLSDIPCIFKHCNLLVLNKSHEKKLQVKSNPFTVYHTAGLVVTNFCLKKKYPNSLVIEMISLV